MSCLSAANFLFPFLPCNCSQPNPSYLSLQLSPYFIALYRRSIRDGKGGYTAFILLPFAQFSLGWNVFKNAQVRPKLFLATLNGVYLCIAHSETYCPCGLA